MIQYIENVLPEAYHNTLCELLLSHKFPWYYNEVTATVYKTNSLDVNWHTDSNTQDSAQLTHHFIVEGSPDSTYCTYVTPVLNIVKNKFDFDYQSIYRIKSNMIIKDSGYPLDKYHIPHIDSPYGVKTAKTLLYYLNDSDGDTYFFDSKQNPSSRNLSVAQRITPKKNCGIIFDSNIWHASSTPIRSPRRVVINFIVY